MHDIKFIRENPEKFDEAMKKRGLPAMAASLMELDKEARAKITELQSLQQKRNEASREVAEIKKKGGDAEAKIAEVSAIKQAMVDNEEATKKLTEELNDKLCRIPNRPADDVPVGADEEANVEVRRHGEPSKFAFEAKEHDALGSALGMMDFDNAAKLSGARFVILKGALAKLERALAQFMLDLHTEEHGYMEVNTPVLVKDNALYGTGQLPKFSEDLFKVGEDFWLIPTAEVTLTNMASGEIIEEEKLPLRYTAFTNCFRSEAGAAGKDTRGMIRQHQFEKVEMVSLTHPEKSYEELERMTACAENILKKLGLAYRVMMLSSGDMGFCAHKTYDLEVWLPGQNRYREISSCSNCGDFQARRMNARFKGKSEKGTRFVHTLNGSGLAVGRTLIAVLENYQNADGSITVPEVLRPYMRGLEVIKAHG